MSEKCEVQVGRADERSVIRHVMVIQPKFWRITPTAHPPYDLPSFIDLSDPKYKKAAGFNCGFFYPST
jgi:hypothetical protein